MDALNKPPLLASVSEYISMGLQVKYMSDMCLETEIS